MSKMVHGYDENAFGNDELYQQHDHSVNQRNAQMNNLVLRARCGDGDAMEELCLRFRPLVLTVARRYIHLSFEDAVQEGYLALIQCIFSFDEARGVPFTGYLNLKLRGDVRTALRRLWRYNETVVHHRGDVDDENTADLWDLVAPTASGDTVSPSHGFGQPSQNEELSMAEWMIVLQQVGLSQRETIGIVTLIEGWSSTTVAKREGVSPDTVKTWRKRGVIKLRRALVSAQRG